MSEQTYTDDERREHTERLRAMIEDDGETWDLSDNDTAALRMALAAVENANLAVCSYCGHIGPRSSQDMAEHALACEKRPEAKLVDMVFSLTAERDALRAALKVARRWIVEGDAEIGWSVERIDEALALSDQATS